MKRITVLAVALILVVSVAFAGSDYPSQTQAQENFNKASADQHQSQGQRSTNINTIGITGQNVSQTASPNQSMNVAVVDKSTTTVMGDYPTPYYFNTPNMTAPATPKPWQLSVSMWSDGSNWPYGNIGTVPSDQVEMHGRMFAKPRSKAVALKTYKTMPKGAYRMGSYVVVAKAKDVDATMLEDGAMAQAKQDGASGIVERDRGFYAQNNLKGSSGGLGMALSILGSIAGNATMFGPSGGFQSGSYISNQDVYIFLAFDTIEVN
jgi:hypothetical protein